MHCKILEFCRRHLLLFGFFNIFCGLLIGFGAGVYTLPILTAGQGLDEATLDGLRVDAKRQGIFRRDLAGSDCLHWGEGIIMIRTDRIWLEGTVSPGPDYRLYLTPVFVETEEASLKIKHQSIEIGPVKTFTNFSLPLPAHANADDYPAVLIWCEAFEQFITAATFTD